MKISYLLIAVCLLIASHNIYCSSSNLDDLLLWGTYKPYLLSTITQKSKSPISVGFAFSEILNQKNDEEEFLEKLRYRMRRNSTGQYSYNNGFDLAIQHIEDKELCVNYNVSFLEEIDHTNKHFKWRYLIDAKPDPQCFHEVFNRFLFERTLPSKMMEHFVYISLQNLEPNKQDPRFMKYVQKGQNQITLNVTNPSKNTSEYFSIDIIDETKDPSRPNIEHAHHCLSTFSDKARTWEIENLIYNHITEDPFNQFTYIDPWKCDDLSRKEDSSLFLSQLKSKVPFKILISYDSKNVPEQITLDQFYKKLAVKKEQLEAEIKQKFPFKNYNKYKFDPKEVEEIIRFGLSNLLGGILYSYGKIKVQDVPENKTTSKELFTASPSRVGFPRGFLWDEGFHQQVICRWNSSLCVRMISTWIDSIDEKGWIPREQARGDEIESNFKQKSYLYQSPREANPPSMMLPIEYLAMKIVNKKASIEEVQDITKFLEKSKNKLKRWMKWLAGMHVNTDPRDMADLQEVTLFRWNCKLPCTGRYLASGLDDYPRHAYGYHPVANLDLHSWLYLFSRTVNMIGFFFNDTEPDLIGFEQNLPRTLGYLIDTRTNLFQDIVADNKVDQTNKTAKYLAGTLGYVNLFPIFFGLVPPNSTYFKATLDLAGNWDHLWTHYGLRSLSKSDSYFMQGDQYWTEPIWIPMNYLMLRGLKRYYGEDADSLEVYKALRENLIENMVENWRETHNFWENYDSFTGKGKGFPSFTGWTTLIVLIMSEQY